jgi:hypothetical protein
MVRAAWMRTAAAAFTIAVASMAEGSSVGRLMPAMEPAANVGGLVVRVHGTHRACRHGSYGKMGMDVGWHRHDRGKVYPCAPDSAGGQGASSPTDRGARQRSGPGTAISRPDTPGPGTPPEKKTGVSSIPKVVPTPAPQRNPTLSNPPSSSTTLRRR